MLNLDDIRQKYDYDCGRTALQIVCKYWGKPLPLFIANLTNEVQGLSPESLEAAFRSLGFKVLSGSWTVSLLNAATKDGKPVVALTQLNGMGHWVTIKGISRGRVYYQCGVMGAVSQKIEDWEKVWIDYSRTNGVFDKWAICPFLED